MTFEKIYLVQGESKVNNYTIIRVIDGIFLFKNVSITSGKLLHLSFKVFPKAIVKFIDSEIHYAYQRSSKYPNLFKSYKESEIEFLRCKFKSERIYDCDWTYYKIKFYGKVSIKDCQFLTEDINLTKFTLEFKEVLILNLSFI